MTTMPWTCSWCALIKCQKSDCEPLHLVYLTDMPSGKATAWSKSSKTLKKRSPSSLILELKVQCARIYCRQCHFLTSTVSPNTCIPVLTTGIYGGFLLGVRSLTGLAFYDWENTELVRRIEIQPKHVRHSSSLLSQIISLPFYVFCSVLFYQIHICSIHLSSPSFLQIFWSDSGELVCIATDESFFILRYLADKVAASHENNEGVTEDGIEDAFEVSVSMWTNP